MPASKQQGMPEDTNQLGHVCYAEPSPVDTLCRSNKPNPISRLMNLIIVIILLLLFANSVDLCNTRRLPVVLCFEY